ncbi:hypothetical protein [Sulfurisoma sediminicola]|uniref:Uncharacterized protein n=1 Tax=Sulfurisoma sediminicola TaxID=1381557 RepID=A0A497XIM5_9PROT|nr:hypothetical protein [Sulfurisoma sediminicola]RLJ67694.1 hypothetical protein DFR35_0243 [Sulfurisoma sediminicola]
MNAPDPVRLPSSYMQRLRSAGIEPGDGAEVQLSKSLLMLATGLVTVATMLWVAIYQLLGLKFSATLPFAFQLLLVGNMLLYFQTRHFGFFRVTQLGLFLFLPFVAHWAAGNVISSSGVILWSVLAPVGAMLSSGARQSLAWFVAWILLTSVSGAADYHYADPHLVQTSLVPLRVSLVFFALNFIAIVSIIYALLCFAVEQKRRIQIRLEQSREATDKLFGSLLL